MSIGKRRYLREVVIIIVIVLAVSYVAMPPRPSKTERETLNQTIGPIDFEDVEVGIILQQIVDAAPKPVRIELCDELSRKRISIHTSNSSSLRIVLKHIAAQLGCPIRLFTGVHGEGEALPKLYCQSPNPDYVVIERSVDV